METRTIKGIDGKTWMAFKVLSAKKRLPMGKLFTSMVATYEKNAEDIWDKILNTGKILSDEEAEDMLKITRKLRAEKGYRHVPDF